MVIYFGANVGLALAPNYTALLVLRMLQAFGSSSVIAIGTLLQILFVHMFVDPRLNWLLSSGAGCIGDISSPSE
jgi:MFS family permease